MRQTMPILTLILVALLAAAPLWGPGMVSTRGGGDSPFLLQRAHQMGVSLRAGVFPVRWMPDGAYGLGYPFFNYYASLPYYGAGLLMVAGVDILTALKLVQTLGFIAAALAMYAWMGRLTPRRWAAWLAAVAYTVAPFHLVNVYVRGDSLSEFYAFVFYPLVLWGLDGLATATSPHRREGTGERGTRTDRGLATMRSPWFIATGLTYAGLILSHNLSAFIFTLVALPLYAIVLWVRRKRGYLPLVIRWPSLIAGLSALGCGVLLSAWYWLPALAELNVVQLGPSTQGFFHYSRHFRTLNLVQWNGLFDYTIAAGHTGDSPFAMSLAQAVLALLGGLVLVGRAVRRRLAGRWAVIPIGLLLSTVMITPLSKPLWDRLPLLPVIQFPWRFLSLQALFTAAATAGLAFPFSPKGTEPTDRPQTGRRRLLTAVRTGWIGLITGLLVLSALLLLAPDRLSISPADVSVDRLQLYEMFTENIGTTIRYEWLPQTATPRPFTSGRLIDPDRPPRAIPLGGADLTATPAHVHPTRQEWQVTGAGGPIAFPLLHWPGWRARVDGTETPAWPVEGSGLVAVEVPPGAHTVTLYLGRTPARATGEATSAIALIGLLAVAVVLRVRNRRSRAPWRGRRWLPYLVWPVVLGLALLASVRLLAPRGGTPPASAPIDDLTMDFIRQPYLHHNPNGVRFGDGPRMMGYTLSSEELAPGDPLTVTVDWQGGGPFTATIRLLPPAAVRNDVRPVVEASVGLQASTTTARLQLPRHISRGPYLIQLEVFGPARERDGIVSLSPVNAHGRELGTTTLRPVWVERGSPVADDEPVLAPFGPAIRLHGASVEMLGSERLAVRLAWSTSQPVAANYAISLRLLDPEGQLRQALDSQPGYGYLPTSTWGTGEWIIDEYVLSLPDDLPPAEGYHLQILLYRMPSLEPLGQVQVGGFPLPLPAPYEAQPAERRFDLPELTYPLGVAFGDQISLAGYDLQQQEERLDLTLWWRALRTPGADYTVFVHLFDPQTDRIVVQSDAQPRQGAYPTFWWLAGEVVDERVSLDLGDVPPGRYGLAVGLYDGTATRLPASDLQGQSIPDNRPVLPTIVEVE